MAVIVLLGVGAVTGLGLWLVLVGMLPPRRSLAAELAGLRLPVPDDDVAAESLDAVPSSWVARAGRPAVRLLLRAGLPTRALRRDLAALGRSAEGLLAEQATAGVVGLALPPAVGVLLSFAGLEVGVTLPAVAALGLAVLMFTLPALGVKAEAAKHRAGFRHALGAFFDLVVVALAGGSGVEEAMADATAVGTGPAFADLRYALAEAHLTGVPPWTALGRLGHRNGVSELVELAASIGLAGTEGARVRASLQARAVALRGRQLADAEASAASATERMSLPVVTMATGFLLFIGYPAAYAVLVNL